MHFLGTRDWTLFSKGMRETQIPELMTSTHSGSKRCVRRGGECYKEKRLKRENVIGKMLKGDNVIRKML